jgi:hypothetical protein
MQCRYHYLVCFDNGRRNEHYFLGDKVDIQPVWEHRMMQKEANPIGTAWGTSSEIWMECPLFAIRISPMDDAARATFEFMHRNEVPPPEVIHDPSQSH